MRFKNSLSKYIYHQFVKRKQHYERKILFTKNENGNYRFPKDWVWISIDFISNYQIKEKIVTHGMSTKLGQVSHLVIHEKRVVNNKIQEKAYNYFSEQTKHGWFSAMPALYDCMKRTKSELIRKEGISVALFVIWSNRASKDFWCAPSHTYPSDIVNLTGIPIIANTTESGHGKTYHDQIGGTVQTHLNRCTGNSTLNILAGKSKSKQICTHLSSTFNQSKSGDLKRIFRNIPYKQIYTKGSPVPSLDINGDGIATFQSACIDGTRLRYRIVSCCCQECVRSRYKKQCRLTAYAGRWSERINISPHKSYGTLVNEQHNQSNHNNNK